MAEHGKRGPNGGSVDIDDPAEVFPPDPAEVIAEEVRSALRLVEWAAHERMTGREANAEAMLWRAARRLSRVIVSGASRETQQPKESR